MSKGAPKKLHVAASMVYQQVSGITSLDAHADLQPALDSCALALSHGAKHERRARRDEQCKARAERDEVLTQISFAMTGKYSAVWPPAAAFSSSALAFFRPVRSMRAILASSSA